MAINNINGIDLGHQTDDSELLSQTYTPKTALARRAQRRWPKHKDIYLFETFKKLCAEYGITELEFLDMEADTSDLQTQVLGQLL